MACSYANLFGTKERMDSFSNPTGLVWDTNMASITLFWGHKSGAM